MNYVYRTVSRRVGHACALGCLLVGTPALAALNSNGIEVLSTTATGVKNGTYIEAAASMRYKHVDTAQRIYTKQLVPIARSTLRSGALAALSRGVMHPGLQIAILAAGFIIGNNNEILSDNGDTTVDFDGDPNFPNGQGSWNWNPESYSAAVEAASLGYKELTFESAQTFPDGRYFVNHSCQYFSSQGYYKSCDDVSVIFTPNDPSALDGYQAPSPTPVLSPVPESDLSQIDPHIPPQLLGELVRSEDSIPEWRDEITVLGSPASDVDSDTNMPPEVASQAGRWAENVAAQLDGQPEPNPDVDSDGKSADEAAYEDQQKQENETPPPFPDLEVDWQTEEVSLPSYSSGIGAGSCPTSQDIALPLGAASFTIDYQPACNLASMVRPALIGICGLIALMIVLRARGGA